MVDKNRALDLHNSSEGRLYIIRTLAQDFKNGDCEGRYYVRQDGTIYEILSIDPNEQYFKMRTYDNTKRGQGIEQRNLTQLLDRLTDNRASPTIVRFIEFGKKSKEKQDLGLGDYLIEQGVI